MVKRTVYGTGKSGQVWTAAVESFRREYKRSGFEFWCDLAEKRFTELSAGKEDDPRYTEEAPVAARFILADTALRWAKGSKKRTR